MEDRANILRNMQICRFCLAEDVALTNIYNNPDAQATQKRLVPLPLQLMACVAIETFQNDGMPQLICGKCRSLTLQAYSFKRNCKKAEDALKLFLATGTLTKPFKKGDFENYLPIVDRSVANRQNSAASKQSQTEAKGAPLAKKIKLEHQVDVGNSTESETNANDPNTVDAFGEYTESGDTGVQESQVQIAISQCFPCPDCDRSFPLEQLLDIHKEFHQRERHFRCEICNRQFFTKYDLGKHLQTHSDEKPYACVICRKAFSRETLLHRHEKVHSDVSKFLCSECDKTFLTKQDLLAHMEKHRKKRPFTCGICGKSFVFKQGLERHELSHTEQKIHKCNYCEASFTSAIKLTRHVTSHAGLRPYPCKICGRTFLLSHHLTRHMRTHYAAKNNASSIIGQHKCDSCSMSFRRKDSLINHSAIHSMVNLKCVICYTEFSDAKSVKDHITTHLSGLPFPCEKCDYSFETQEQLEEHELKHAEMEYEDQIEKEIVEESRKAAESNEEEEEVVDLEDDDYESTLPLFTIINSLDNPEIVRRSLRARKTRTFPDFLKDDIDSDEEEDSQDKAHDSNDQDFHPRQETREPLSDDDVIKPVIRSEGTKVYKRKPTLTPKSTANIVLNSLALQTAPLSQINQPQVTTIENLGLTSQELNALPTEKYVDMRIGDRNVRVQKLILTKEEMRTMAKEGRIKGNTLLIKNPGHVSAPSSAPKLFFKPKLESSISDKPILIKSSTKKTYQRKITDRQRSERVFINDVIIEENDRSYQTDQIDI